MIRLRKNSRVSAIVRFVLIFLYFLPGISSAGVVTLKSIEIFNTHEWLTKPTVYFYCWGEKLTILPDVKKAHHLYTFKGEESWQPLTELEDRKCKRCGFYEKDTLKADDIFDEWELCPSDFLAPDGKYVHFKEEEFNATFLCPQCIQGAGYGHDSDAFDGPTMGKRMSVGLVITISLLAFIVSTLGVVAAYKYWQKKKREQERARFLKLFENGDDIEDELGLGPSDNTFA